MCCVCVFVVMKFIVVVLVFFFFIICMIFFCKFLEWFFISVELEVLDIEVEDVYDSDMDEYDFIYFFF